MKETEGKIRKKREKVENYLGKDRRNQRREGRVNTSRKTGRELNYGGIVANTDGEGKMGGGEGGKETNKGEINKIER